MEKQEIIKGKELITRTLFRGKRKDNNKWIEGDLLRVFNYDYSQPNSWNYGIKPLGKTSEEVKYGTIGQLTGLKDKNDIDIFAGDICEAYSVDNGNEVLSVGFKDGAFVFLEHNWPIRDWKQHYINVIGNIFDNPELLIN